MKIFISWSGERSKLLAEGLRIWLPGVINAAEPWLSSSDLEPGSHWGPELARQLEVTKYGILCVTAENLNAPWLLFEAGALSKYVNESRVIPLVLDIKPTDIQGPLAQFQAVRAIEEEISKLVTKINQAVFEAGEIGVNQLVINSAFQLWWPQLKKCIDSIPAAIQDVRKNERSQKEIVEEILGLVRKMDNQATQERGSTVDIPSSELYIQEKQILFAERIERIQERIKVVNHQLKRLEEKSKSTELDEDEKRRMTYLLRQKHIAQLRLENLYKEEAVLKEETLNLAKMKTKAKSII